MWRALRGRGLRREDVRRQALLLAAVCRHEGDPAADAVKDIFVGSGCGVGGGSLGYANTLYRALPGFYSNPQWEGLADWQTELAPHYDTAERTLGVTEYEGDGPADLLLKEYGESIGVGDTYQKTRVGVFFGEPGKTVPDPYFDGQGPTAPDACGAGPAWSAAATAPRTRS